MKDRLPTPTMLDKAVGTCAMPGCFTIVLRTGKTICARCQEKLDEQAAQGESDHVRPSS